MAVQTVVPNSKGRIVARFDGRCYSGQYSTNGTRFTASSQDFSIKVFDTEDDGNWKQLKHIRANQGRWTLTDTTLSPNERHIAFSSIIPIITVASIDAESSGDSRPNATRTINVSANDDVDEFGVWRVLHRLTSALTWFESP